MSRRHGSTYNEPPEFWLKNGKPRAGRSTELFARSMTWARAFDPPTEGYARRVHSDAFAYHGWLREHDLPLDSATDARLLETYLAWLGQSRGGATAPSLLRRALAGLTGESAPPQRRRRTDVEEQLDAYESTLLTDKEWVQFRPLIRELVRQAEPATVVRARRLQTAFAGFVRFRLDERAPVDATMWTARAIDHYLQLGLPAGTSRRTLGDYRSRLRTLQRTATRGMLPTPEPGSSAARSPRRSGRRIWPSCSTGPASRQPDRPGRAPMH